MGRTTEPRSLALRGGWSPLTAPEAVAHSVILRVLRRTFSASLETTKGFPPVCRTRPTPVTLVKNFVRWTSRSFLMLYPQDLRTLLSTRHSGFSVNIYGLRCR